MNITFITGSPDTRCGIGTYTSLLVCAIAETAPEINLTLLVPHGKRPDTIPQSVNFVTAGPGKEFKKYVKQHKPDILHIQYPSLTRAFADYRHNLLWCRLMYGSKVVITAHEDMANNWRGAVMAASKILTLKSKRSIPAWKRLISKAVIEIKNPPMLPQVQLSADQRQQIRRNLGVQSNRKLISFLGFLTPNINLEWLFASCSPEKHDLVIMGQVPKMLKTSDQEYRELARKYNWDPDKIFKGYVPDRQAAETLAASDIVFLPFALGHSARNTSYLAAQLQGTYIVTSSQTKDRYDPKTNTYFVSNPCIENFKKAVNHTPAPKQTSLNKIITWKQLSQLHINLYKDMLGV